MKAVMKRNRPMWNEFPLIFDELFNDWSSVGSNAFTPAVNVRENEEAYNVELYVPGFKKEDINVTIEDQSLTVSSEIESENQVSDEGYTRREFVKRSFSRAFTLPEGIINNDKILAKYENGILHVELPKLDEVKPKPAKRLKIG